MITVGKASKMFGLSRTALLYYDSLGLLTVRRAENGYRPVQRRGYRAFTADHNAARCGRALKRDIGLPCVAGF